jgi:two-component system, cell cycle sensor histidine kinase and response regulator CckA
LARDVQFRSSRSDEILRRGRRGCSRLPTRLLRWPLSLNPCRARQTETVLVAENDTALRKLVAAILHRAGYHVLSAGGGKEAVAAAAKSAGGIDLLVTDIVMPGMGGAELYAWLKTERPNLRVLFISGLMNREPLEGAFLKKPFTPGELLEKVCKVLADSAAA